MVSPVFLMKPMASQAGLLDFLGSDLDPARLSFRREKLLTPDIDDAGIVGPENAFQRIANQLLNVVSVGLGICIYFRAL
jgi:hypothetical protein